MSTLLPTLLSSDEEDNNASAASSKSITKKKKRTDDDDGNSTDESELDSDFEFGGLLGEDEGGNLDYQTATATAWSYKSALEILNRNDNSHLFPARMDVASIIAAARSNIRKSKGDVVEKEVDDEIKEDDSMEEDDEIKEDDSKEEDGDSKEEDDDSGDDDESSCDSGYESSSSVDDADLEMETDTLRVTKEPIAEQPNNQDDAEADAKFYSKITTSTPSKKTADVQTFSQLPLCRPILRGIASAGFVTPTPIQSACIPPALARRDISASAVTGSGKTAAFLLPILETCVAQKSRSPSIRALILTPTRELAAQCLGMMESLSRYCVNVRPCLIVGGAKNVASQASELRTKPDVVIATPGRLLDHLTNSAGVDLEDLEVLVLDEADRLLDLGFTEEVEEIIKCCGTERQTMLFSATMNTKVEDLVKLSLKKPIRIKIGTSPTEDFECAPRLDQEFVRVRSGNEGNRMAMLLALLTRTFQERTIVFFDTKRLTHDAMILCGLCGIKATELHGNLTQTQRLEALEVFREGGVDILLATDLAARGLDIASVRNVINYEMPGMIPTYIHRIGRTARAGRSGRSCTLIGEGRRHLMKEIVKDDSDGKNLKKAFTAVKSRTIPAQVIQHFLSKIQSLEPYLKEVKAAEAVARFDRVAEMEANRAQNLITHGDEIKSRLKREYPVNKNKEEKEEKPAKVINEPGTGKHNMTRKKRRAQEARLQLDQFRQEEQEQEQEEMRQIKPSKRIPSEKTITTSIRASKKLHHEKQLDKNTQSLYDDSVQPIRKKRKKEALDPHGSGSMFGEENIMFAKKETVKEKDSNNSVLKSEHKFNGFDPDKSFGKKKGHNKFKSKSKFKRKK